MKRVVAFATLLLCANLLLATGPAPAQQGQNQIQVMDLGPAVSGQGAQQPGKQAQQVKQQKQKECARQANDQNLRGNDRQRFMRDCMAGS